MDSIHQIESTLLSPMIAGLFALLGGFLGAWLTKRTEYEKWLRQERAIAFATFLRQILDVYQQAVGVVHNTDWTAERRDRVITELFVSLSAQENVVRLYLKPVDRGCFSELIQELWLLFSTIVNQGKRNTRSKEIFKEIQSMFERTLHS